jgi:hypothetical protein
LQLGCSAFQRWGHHLARPAPGGPEIDDDRYVVALNLSVEFALVVDRDGGTGEHRLVTVAALGLLDRP